MVTWCARSGYQLLTVQMDNAKLWINCIEMEYSARHWFGHDELLLLHSSVKKNNKLLMYPYHSLQSRIIRNESKAFWDVINCLSLEMKVIYSSLNCSSWEYCPWWPWSVRTLSPFQRPGPTLTSRSPPSRIPRTQTSMVSWTSLKPSLDQMGHGASQRYNI